MSKKVIFASFILSFLVFGSWSFSQFHFSRFKTFPLPQFSSSPSTIGSPEPESVKIIFVGDIMLSRDVAKQMEKNQDYTFPFLKIKDFLNSADLVFGNLEGPISDRGANQGSIYSFRADPKAVVGLRLAGFKVLSLANNHIFDWGAPALLQTIELLDQNDIFSAGVGGDYDSANRILVLQEKEIKFGFFAMTNLYPDSLAATKDSPGISNPDFGVLANVIKAAKAEDLIDFMVVSLHWGNEYEKEPEPWQVEQAHELADAGADLVIGHHPHVVQSFERYGDSLIFYSLGNFVFDQRFSEETMEGLAVEVEFKKGGEIPSKLHRIKLNEFFQPELGEIVDPSITLRAR